MRVSGRRSGAAPCSALTSRHLEIKQLEIAIAKTKAAQIRAGAAPDVVRLSIGIEDAADIIADLDQALAKAV